MNAPNLILSSQARAALKAHLAMMPMASVVSGRDKGVATLDLTGLRPVLVLLKWNVDDGLTAKRCVVPEAALPSNVMSGNREAVQTAVDACERVATDKASDIGFSEALEWFGLRGRPSAFAERFAATFAALNPDVHVDMDYVRDVIDERLSDTSLTEAREQVDHAALHALRATASFPKGPYAFYASTGARREDRHQAAHAFPFLAKTMASAIGTKSAIDRRLPLASALQTAFGADDTGKPKMSKALTKRLQGMDWRDKGVPADVVVDVLSGMPPEWFPKDEAEWDAFVDLADTFFRWLPPVIGERPEALAAGSGGKWVEFRAKIAKAFAPTLPPDDLTEDERAAWRPTVDESKDALNGGCETILAMVRQFRDLVVLPVASSKAVDRDVYLSEESRLLASQTSGRILCRGKSLPAILDLNRHWHTQMAKILEATAETDDDKQAKRDVRAPKGAIKEVAPDGWPPLCDVYVAPNGVTVMPLTDPRELTDEGAAGLNRPGLDSNGIQGLGHCVGTYAQTCRTHGHHIVSFRLYEDDGVTFTRLSTAEFGSVKADTNKVNCVQHRGSRNDAAPDASAAAFKWFVDEVEVGGIPINRQGIMSYMSTRRKIDDDVTVQSGYDRKDLKVVARGLEAWGPYLNKRFRGLSVEALRAMPEMEEIVSTLCPAYAPAPR